MRRKPKNPLFAFYTPSGHKVAECRAPNKMAAYKILERRGKINGPIVL